MRQIKNFLEDGQGQDLVEYSLLIALIALAFAAVMTGAASGVNNIQNNGGSVLSVAVSSS